MDCAPEPHSPAYRARLATATPVERQTILRALCPQRGVHGVWLYPDGRVELRGIAPVSEPPAPVLDEPSIPLALKLVTPTRSRSSKAHPTPAQTKATTSVPFSVSGVAEKRAYARRKRPP